MKKIYFFFLVLVSFQLCGLSQAVRLSNNTNLSIGFPISPSKAIFIQQDTDSLWVTDGTPGNTLNLNIPVTLSIEGGFAFWNNKLYFCGSNAANGTELWVTDGTTLGTSMVKDIWAFY